MKNLSFTELSVSNEVIKFAKIGDTVIKLENDNTITIQNKNKTKSFQFKIISDKLRRHKNFPPEWKNKWLNN